MYGLMRRLKNSRNKLHFDRVAKGVLTTPPLKQRADSPLFLSLVCHRDLTSYLLAIKSLYVSIGRGRITIINDGSLTSDDLGILSHHLPRLEVLNYGEIRAQLSPRADFFWDRLVKIIELSRADYVIQVDADTLVTAAVPEVIDCWQDNRSFLLGTASGRSISPAPEAARMVQSWIQTNHWTDTPIGTEAEASLDKLPGANQRYYVHASAGFAGFAKGAFNVSELKWFSSCMASLLGSQRWMEYGSEQIASNYMLANAPRAMVLPFPKYACFEPHLKHGNDHAFLHFLGAYRYDHGVYRQWAAEAIARYNRIIQQF